MSAEAQSRISTLLADLMASPKGYLHSFDLAKNAGLLIEANREFFRNAIFLDARVLQPGMTGAWVPLSEIWARTKGPKRRPIHFIFHVGHAGSTLISRLLDEAPNVLGLREPETLRALAMTNPAAFAEMFEGVYALLGRRFAENETVIVKATSICNALAPRLLAMHPENRAVALTVSLRAHLANLLGKKQATDVTAFAPHRLKGLQRRVPGFSLALETLSLGELVAFSWLAEVEALSRVRESSAQMVLLDFDRVLANRDTDLKLILAQFGLDPETDLSASRILETYAKQPDFPFTADTRRRILVESEAANREAIAAGENLVADLCARYPALERAVGQLEG